MQSKFDLDKHHRRSIRLPNYDYSGAGAYFVTIVAWHRECLFGDVVKEEMVLNQYGRVVQWEWLELPKRLQYIELGAYAVMPNHFHGILIFRDHVGATRQDLIKTGAGNESDPTESLNGIVGSPVRKGPQPKSLGTVMSQFKSRVTKRLWKFPNLNKTPIWQRNYYEHVIRNVKDLQNKTDYIESNPMLWDEDDENPVNL